MFRLNMELQDSKDILSWYFIWKSTIIADSLTLGPSMKKYLWWKKYLTIFQMVQFIVVFSRSIIVIFGIVDRGYPRYFSLISASITVLFFVMFMQFYMQSYKANKKLKDN